MSPEKIEALLQKIDEVVGKPEDETPEERQRRAEIAQRRMRRRAAGLQ